MIICKKNFINKIREVIQQEINNFYSENNKEIEILEKQNLIYQNLNQIENNLNILLKFQILQSIDPDLFNNFKIHLWNKIDEPLKKALSRRWSFDEDILQIKNLFAKEIENLNDKLFLTGGIPFLDRIEIYKKLSDFGTYNSDVCQIKYLYTLLIGRKFDVVEPIIEKFSENDYISMDLTLLLRIIGFYRLKQNDDKAWELLEIYIKKAGTDNIPHWLAVADLAWKHGITNSRIEKAHLVYEEIRKNEDKEYLKNYLQNKSIAIVGNGPQELGKNSGKEIDSHDVVVRFNLFSLDDKYKKDYGTKTNIWCVVPLLQFTLPNNYVKDILIICHDIYMNYIYSENQDNMEIYYNQMQKGVKLCAYSDYIIKHFQDYINTPSTGFTILSWLKYLNSNITIKNVYGFSFKDEVISDFVDYTFKHKETVSYTEHSLLIEKDILKKIFNGEIK